MTATWQTVTPDQLTDRVARWLAGTPGRLRVAVDGPPASAPDELARSLVEPLRALGRPTALVLAATFWRDASLRLEHGHHDAHSYLSWLDADALRREVLHPAAATGMYLPSLRDPVTNRSTRESPRTLEPNAVLLVSGALLLGLGLPFDRTIHLDLPAAARARRTAAEDAWTLPAFARYEADAHPGRIADVVVRVDRRLPVVRGLP